MLGVFGLSIRTQERDLEEEFSRYGTVEKVTIVYDQRVRTQTSSFQLPLLTRSIFSLTVRVALVLFAWPLRRMQDGALSVSTGWSV